MSTLKVNSIQDTGGNNGVTPGEINKGIVRNAESYFDDVELFIKSKLPKKLKEELFNNISLSNI